MLEGVSLLNLAFLQVTTVWSAHKERHNENYFAYISALLTVVLFLGGSPTISTGSSSPSPILRLAVVLSSGLPR